MKSKRKKKVSAKSLHNKIWPLCKAIIRAKYGNECYICHAKNLSGSNWHTAHLIPRSTCGAYLKYDLRNLRPSCYHCNINLGGNGALFFLEMTKREGKKYVDEIFADRLRVCKLQTRIEELLPKYQKLAKEL